jgi:hypothetical protein
MNENLAIIICPPLHKYKEAPKDQPGSELFDCPKCNQKMWLSQRKKGVLMFYAGLNKDILLACYDCITKIVKEDPNILEAIEVKI